MTDQELVDRWNAATSLQEIADELGIRPNTLSNTISRLRKKGFELQRFNYTRYGGDVRKRFMAKVERSQDGCWEWFGAKHPRGYGRFWYRGRPRFAHRVSYELFVGPIPSGKELDHLCRNTRCVNPDHLEAVTHTTNMQRGHNQLRDRTHCQNGHAFSGDNLMFVRSGNGRMYRKCRACYEEYKKMRNAKRRKKCEA